MTLKQREVIMTFKILTGRSPQYLEKLFSISQNVNYNLRSNQTKSKLPKPKTNFLKRSFSYRAAKSWNELPSGTTENYNNLLTLSFKRQLFNSHVQPIVNSYNLCLLMYIIVANTRPFENQHCKYY